MFITKRNFPAHPYLASSYYHEAVAICVHFNLKLFTNLPIFVFLAFHEGFEQFKWIEIPATIS